MKDVNAEDSPEKEIDFPIIGIGASAGGLAPFETVLEALPEDLHAAIVFMQHLAAAGKGLLPDVLRAKFPSRNIIEISDGAPLEAGNVYVNPPGVDIIVKNGLFRVRRFAKRTVHYPIDVLFTSLAGEAADKLIAVVLSGAGTDGARGIREVQCRGGTVLVQDPSTAEFGAMPKSAVEAGHIDEVLAPENIAGRIVSLVQAIVNQEGSIDISETGGLDALFNLLHEKAGYGFEFYKRNVIARRVQRRMSLQGLSTIGQYRALMDKDPSEIARLASDLMIGVTAFFRDPDAWESLKKNVIARLIAEKKPGESIRVWTPGCSTGEEAYSIAMVLLREIESAGKRSDVQVFATDINERALTSARSGEYPASVTADIPPGYLKTYFTCTEDGLHVRANKYVRDHVVFARQDLLTDPPFSKLDCIICRNLLIYLEPESQDKCISVFHYALKQGGYLFLGNAESLGRRKGLFKALGDKGYRIYQPVVKAGPLRYDFPIAAAPEPSRKPGAAAAAPGAERGVTEFAHETLLSLYAPASVLINNRFEILYLNGPLKKFIEPPPGQPSFDFISWIPSEMRNRVRGALFSASQTQQPVSVPVGLPDANHEERTAALTVRPYKNPADASDMYLIVFMDKDMPQLPEAATLQGAEADHAAIRQLERELLTTRDELQTNVEELKSANEELQSSNEEMQASNEELETSREELQSLNEELSTVNAQLQGKIEEQEATNNDLNNFLTSTNIPTLFLDQSFRVRRYTPAMTRLIKLIPSDVGRPIADMALGSLGAGVLDDAQAVMDELAPVKKEVPIAAAWFVRSTLPYRTADNRIEGVVITYVDISERKRMEEDVRLLAKFPSENPNPILRLSNGGVVLYVNEPGRPLMRMWNASVGMAAGGDVRKMIAETVAGKTPKTVEIDCEERTYSFVVVPLAEAGYVNMYGRDITLRKKAEEALAQSRLHNEFLAGILDSSSQPFAVGYPDGRLGLFNKAFERLTGYGSEELQSIDWATALTPQQWREAEAKKLAELHETGLPVRYEKEYVRKDGSRVPIELLVHLVKDPDGKPLYYYSFLTDITERKRAEKALRESEERFRNLVWYAPAGIYEVDFTTGRYTEVNEVMCRILGYTRDELLAVPAFDILDDEGKARFASRVRDAQAGKPPDKDVEYRVRTKDGRLLWAHLNVTFRWEGASIVGATVVGNDITEQKMAEDALRQSQRLMMDIIDGSPSMIFLKDREGRFITINKQLEKAFRFPREQLIGKTDHDFFPREVADFYRANDTRVMDSGKPIQVEEVSDLPDGRHVFLANKFPLVNGSGEIYGVCAISHDITERKEAEERLRAQAALLDLARDAIIVRDASDTITFWNRGAEATYGYTGQEARGRVLHEILKARFPTPLDEINAELEEKGQWEGELAHTRKDGREIVVASRWALQSDELGRRTGVLAINRDITARKRLEEALRRHAEQLAAANRELESFSYSLSHDLRGPLRSMKGFSSILLEGYLDKIDAEGRDFLRKISGSADKMSGLIEDMLGLAKISRQEMKPGEIDLGAIAGPIFEELRQAEPRRSVGVVISGELKAYGDSRLMNIALSNLIGNSWKYTGKTDGARIELGAVEMSGERVFFVRDNGAGFDMAYSEKLFKPFQRLHSDKQFPGTGIGLAIVGKVIQRHGGRIWAESQPGKGATFYFTVSVDKTNSGKEEEIEESGPILIVDDNPDDIYLSKWALSKSRADRVVEAAAGGLQAMERLGNAETPALVFLDLKMPGTGGLEVLRFMRARGQTRYVPVVMLTSSTMEKDMKDCYDAGANGFLHKAHDLSEFAQKLEAALHYWMDRQPDSRLRGHIP